MSSYWPGVTVFLGLVYALSRKLVWRFLWMRKELNKDYSEKLARAHAAIHDRKFLPVIASIYDSVAEQMKLSAGGVQKSTHTEWVIGILTEDSIRARFRDAFRAYHERIALDEYYTWLCHLSICVAVAWLVVIACGTAYFFLHFDVRSGVLASLWAPLPGLRATFVLAPGALTLGLFWWTLHRFCGLLEANPLEEAKDVVSPPEGR